MSEPLTARPIGVRPMLTITASDMTFLSSGNATYTVEVASGSSLAGGGDSAAWRLGASAWLTATPVATTFRLPSAWRARRSFLSYLPTLVRGTSSTNAHCSGSRHFTTPTDRSEEH